jgi:hypothetical protein
MMMSGPAAGSNAGRGEVEADRRVDLNLIGAQADIRSVLDGEELPVWNVERFHCGIKGRCLAAAGGAGDRMIPWAHSSGAQVPTCSGPSPASEVKLDAFGRESATPLSPNTVGIVDTRKSISTPRHRNLDPPILRQTPLGVSSRAMILMREVMAARTSEANVATVRGEPSMR